MPEQYQPDQYYALLIQGKWNRATDYLSGFPAAAPLLEAQLAFRRSMTLPGDGPLQRYLMAYMEYFRDVFLLETAPEDAESALLARILALFPGKSAATVSEAEETLLSPAFSAQGYRFLGGKTAGFFGPYVWSRTEEQEYEVELPEGTARYPVRLLSGFLMKSWLDCISLGQLSAGGWADEDGVICCIRDSYDLESEAFRVSLLKHEAQHARDLARYPGISQENLEYRAKLVELIYSGEQVLLPEFLAEADDSNPANGHAMAAARLKREFAALSVPVDSIPCVQKAARQLFQQSCRELNA